MYSKAKKILQSIFIVGSIIVASSNPAWAGRVRQDDPNCESSCRVRGLSSSSCRDFSTSNGCYQVLVVGNGSLSSAASLLQQTRTDDPECTHSCRTRGLNRDSCRDYKTSNGCYQIIASGGVFNPSPATLPGTARVDDPNCTTSCQARGLGHDVCSDYRTPSGCFQVLANN